MIFGSGRVSTILSRGGKKRKETIAGSFIVFERGKRRGGTWRVPAVICEGKTCFSNSQGKRKEGGGEWARVKLKKKKTLIIFSCGTLGEVGGPRAALLRRRGKERACHKLGKEKGREKGGTRF